MTLSERTNRPLAAAAVILILTAGAHAFMGGPEINAVVQQSALDPVVRSVSAVVWHALTVLFLIMGAAAFWAARRTNMALVVMLGAICFSFVAVFLVIGLTALGTIWLMPQWIFFVVAGALLLWGLRGKTDAAFA